MPCKNSLPWLFALAATLVAVATEVPSADDACPVGAEGCSLPSTDDQLTLLQVTRFNSSTSGAFTVTSGNCKADGDCLTSPNYPLKYSNRHKCLIRPNLAGRTINIEDFQVETQYDYLSIDGQKYHGGYKPSSGITSKSQIIWSADRSDNKKGWKICASNGSPSAPTPTQGSIGNWVPYLDDDDTVTCAMNPSRSNMGLRRRRNANVRFGNCLPNCDGPKTCVEWCESRYRHTEYLDYRPNEKDCREGECWCTCFYECASIEAPSKVAPPILTYKRVKW